MMKCGDKARPGHETDGELSTTAALIFAVAAGLSVANIYYAQPLLDSMADDFGISAARIGLVVMLTQVGYGAGLIFVAPLGDLIDRRRLIVGQGILSATALIAVAAARSEAILFASMAAVGLLAVVVQILVAFAASLARPEHRGKAIGMVTSGVVTGVLAARVVAGALADLGGWRTVYLTSALLTLIMVGLLLRISPRERSPRNIGNYAASLRSIPVLFLCDPTLLVRSFLALLVFAAFSTFWTALVLPLSAPPYSYSSTLVGMFGLVGLAGAIAAAGAGRIADRGFGEWTTGLSLTILLGSWALIALLPRSIPLLVTGVVLLDFAVQAVHVTNQSIILDRHPEARSRLIGGYMVFYSLGSAAGAIGATALYARYGWIAVSALGAAFSATALLTWACTYRQLRGGWGANQQSSLRQKTPRRC